MPDFRRGPDRGHPVEFIPVAGFIQERKLKRAVLSGPPAVGNQPVEFPRQLRIERAGQKLKFRPVREDDRPEAAAVHCSFRSQHFPPPARRELPRQRSFRLRIKLMAEMVRIGRAPAVGGKRRKHCALAAAERTGNP